MIKRGFRFSSDYTSKDVLDILYPEKNNKVNDISIEDVEAFYSKDNMLGLLNFVIILFEQMKEDEDKYVKYISLRLQDLLCRYGMYEEARELALNYLKKYINDDSKEAKELKKFVYIIDLICAVKLGKKVKCETFEAIIEMGRQRDFYDRHLKFEIDGILYHCSYDDIQFIKSLKPVLKELKEKQEKEVFDNFIIFASGELYAYHELFFWAGNEKSDKEVDEIRFYSEEILNMSEGRIKSESIMEYYVYAMDMYKKNFRQSNKENVLEIISIESLSILLYEVLSCIQNNFEFQNKRTIEYLLNTFEEICYDEDEDYERFINKIFDIRERLESEMLKQAILKYVSDIKFVKALCFNKKHEIIVNIYENRNSDKDVKLYVNEFALAFINTSDEVKALEILKKHSERGIKSKDTYLMIAQIYENYMGDYKRAYENYKRAEKIHPNNEEIKVNIDRIKDKI